MELGNCAARADARSLLARKIAESHHSWCRNVHGLGSINELANASTVVPAALPESSGSTG